MTTTAPTKASARAYLWALGLLWLLPTGVFLVGYAVLDQDVHGASCEGIGFGCSLSAADTWGLVWVMVGLPAFFFLGLAAVVVIAVVQRRRRTRS